MSQTQPISTFRLFARRLDAIAQWHGYKNCKDPECILCGILDCPEGEPLHYHHDGCPAGCDVKGIDAEIDAQTGGIYAGNLSPAPKA